MERMKELTVAIQDEYEWKVIYRTELYTEEEYKQLEEENKKLKDFIEMQEKECEDYIDENQNLEDELFAWKQMYKKIKNIINETIEIANAKDEYDAITYLVNEKDKSNLFDE